MLNELDVNTPHISQVRTTLEKRRETRTSLRVSSTRQAFI